MEKTEANPEVFGRFLREQCKDHNIKNITGEDISRAFAYNIFILTKEEMPILLSCSDNTATSIGAVFGGDLSVLGPLLYGESLSTPWNRKSQEQTLIFLSNIGFEVVTLEKQLSTVYLLIQ